MQQAAATTNQLQFYCKADHSFLLAYRKSKNAYKKIILFHLLQIIAFTILIPIDIGLLQTGDKMVYAQSIALFVSIISLLITIYQFHIIFLKFGLIGYLQYARDTNHTSIEPVTRMVSEQQCTSTTIFNAQYMVMIEGLDQNIQELYVNIANQQFEEMINGRFNEVSLWEKIYQFTSWLSMLLVIVLMASSSHLNPAQIAVLVVYLILEAYNKIKIFIILLLIALSPIICIFLCIYYCCCKPKQIGEGPAYLNIKPTSATTEDIVKANGQCSICLQDIKINENIIKLKCSQKHIFHQGCLSKWSKVKSTCPNCRSQLPMRYRQPIGEQQV